MNFERWQDLRPAFVCSEAVLKHKNADVENYLNEIRKKYPGELPFDQVHVSADQVDDPRSMKFLVAYGREATFIAFSGGSDSKYGRDHEKKPTGTDLHATVSELTTRFLGPFDSKLLPELFRSRKRLVFCGHRLGGAVAQMVTSLFWNHDQSGTTISEDSDSVVAISFGAPQIWDSRTIDECYGDPRYKKCFLNVSNDEDPRQSLLEDGLQLPNRGSLTFGTQMSGKSRRVDSAVRSCLPSIASKSLKPWNRRKFKKYYQSAMEDVLALAQLPVPHDATDQSLPRIVVLSPAPVVISASRKASDFGSYITIEGSHLLFLRERVKLNGLQPWETKVQTDEELIIFSPEKTKPDDTCNSASKVVIKTAFGGISHDISESDTDKPLRFLSKIVQTFSVLATPGPFCNPPSDEVLAHLDDIVKCVPNSMKDDEKALSTLFREGANIEEMNARVRKVTKFLNTSHEIEYDKNIYVILGLVFGGALVAAGLVLIPVGGAALAVAGAATIGAILTTSVGVAAVGSGGVIAVCLSPKKFMLKNYGDMLLLAIHEASLWICSASDSASKSQLKLSSGLRGQKPLHLKPSELDLAKLELSLQQEVERSESKLDQLMKLVHDPAAKCISLQSSYLKDASLKSKHNFLRRMNIVAKTVDLYNRKVKSIEFLGLVGEEDSGKTTFIKNVVERAKAASPVPQVGHDIHTEAVTPYRLRDQFYLVDFPGSNGTDEKYADAWVQFTALPSFCVLLLDFKGDIKKEQVQTFKKLHAELDSKITVVFNKVDQVYKPRDEKIYTAQYFTDHRTKSAKLLGCDGKDVHYVCLDPYPMESLTRLRKVGVLGFEELAYKLGEWLGRHSDSESHRVLLDCGKAPGTNGNSSLTATTTE